MATFTVKDPDWELSPFTGMSRQHYLDMAHHVLERVFSTVGSLEDPLSFPLMPGSKAYPEEGAPAWRWASHRWECLERTFCLAGPLLHAEKDARVGRIVLAEYFQRHLLEALTPGHVNSVPLPGQLPDATYQFTCEFGGLCKTLLLLPHVLWDTAFTRAERDAMAVTISVWAHHRTTQNNWRIFNVLALSFLKKNGYAIDDELLRSHLLWISSYHSGDGWYLEQTYNYYTISLFVVYCTIWCRTFGDEYYPDIARVIERSSVEAMKTYTRFFARDGFVNMWSRSICYRTWISGGFGVSFMFKEGSPLDPGFARRLCSGSLLQFVQHPDFFHNSVPSLGFYGPCDFVLQNYSCSGSPMLMWLPFICLALPEDSPFWTARENEGFWPSLGTGSSTAVLEKPGLVLVCHGSSGTSEILPGKVYYDDPNYSKLVYNTHFPWEDHDRAAEGATSMEYAFRSLDPRDMRNDDVNFYLTGIKVGSQQGVAGAFTTSQFMTYNGVRNDVVYRQAMMRRPPNNGVGYIIDLADIVIPGGVIRVDRTRIAFEYELKLGHFGLPGRAVVASHRDGRALTAFIPGRSVALISYCGWDTLASLVHAGCSAEAPESTLLYLSKKRDSLKNPPMEIQVCVMLHKRGESTIAWTLEELDPIASLQVFDVMPESLSTMGVKIVLRNGAHYVVDFDSIDGHRMW